MVLSPSQIFKEGDTTVNSGHSGLSSKYLKAETQKKKSGGNSELIRRLKKSREDRTEKKGSASL